LKKGHHIITGKIGSGKSSCALSLAKRLVKQGKKVSGWISIKNMEEKGYDIIFIRSSRFSRPKRFIREAKFSGSLKWRRFWFSGDIFRQAGLIVSAKKGDIFIIDEVGPLELEYHKGFWRYLARIYKTYPTTVTVVRRGCIKELMSEVS